MFPAVTQGAGVGGWAQSTSWTLCPLIKIGLATDLKTAHMLLIWFSTCLLAKINTLFLKVVPDTRDVSVYFYPRAGVYSGVWEDHRWARLSDLERGRLCRTCIQLQRQEALWVMLQHTGLWVGFRDLKDHSKPIYLCLARLHCIVMGLLSMLWETFRIMSTHCAERISLIAPLPFCCPPYLSPCSR